MNSTSQIIDQLKQYGLHIRGSFTTSDEDTLPKLPDKCDKCSLVLVGNLGSSLWDKFSSSAEYQNKIPNPMDQWSMRIGETLAKKFSGIALYPFEGPPYYPFLRWANRSADTHPSLLGLGIHHNAGLWHAFRFALLLPFEVDHTVNKPQSSPCESCEHKPCLSACPVDAFTGIAYKSSICVDYLKTKVNAQCNDIGCLARHACPIGNAYQYTPEHAQFHMRAFLSDK